MKTISIVMCTYNGELYLRQQLDSLFAQTRPADEIIVQDDCSTDSTPAILAEYASKHPEMNVSVNGERLGYNRNFIAAVQKATGDYIALSDQDDVWRSDKLAVMERNMGEGVSMAFHNSALFVTTPSETTGLRYNTQRPCTDALFITVKPCIPGHEMMFRRDAIATVRRLNGLNIMYDYSIATICANSGRVVYVDDTLVYWRRHAGAATFAERKDEKKAAGYAKSLRALFDRNRRLLTKNYFSLWQRLMPVWDDDCRRVVDHLASGHMVLGGGGIVAASLICLRHRRSMFPHGGWRGVLRAAFLPINFIRDYSVFIIRQQIK